MTLFPVIEGYHRELQAMSFPCLATAASMEFERR